MISTCYRHIVSQYRASCDHSRCDQLQNHKGGLHLGADIKSVTLLYVRKYSFIYNTPELVLQSTVLATDKVTRNKSHVWPLATGHLVLCLLRSSLDFQLLETSSINH